MVPFGNKLACCCLLIFFHSYLQRKWNHYFLCLHAHCLDCLSSFSRLCACMHTISTVPTLLFLKFCELWQEVVQKSKRTLPHSSPLWLTLISLRPSFPSILQRVPSGLVNVFIHIHFSHSLLSNPLQPGCSTGLLIGPSLIDLKHISNILSGAMKNTLLLWCLCHKCMTSIDTDSAAISSSVTLS